MASPRKSRDVSRFNSDYQRSGLDYPSTGIEKIRGIVSGTQFISCMYKRYISFDVINGPMMRCRASVLISNRIHFIAEKRRHCGKGQIKIDHDSLSGSVQKPYVIKIEVNSFIFELNK